MGDVVIALPYLYDLKNKLPQASLHFLTRRETSSIPGRLPFIDRVIKVGGGRNRVLQLLHLLGLMPYLMYQRYDIVLDLQNHRISSFLLKVLRPTAFSCFDRYSPRSAGDRNRTTIERGVGFPIERRVITGIQVDQHRVDELLLPAMGKSGPIVVINPAGLFPTRQWPLANYVEFIRLFETDFPQSTFLLVGLTDRIGKARELLGKETSGSIVDLVGSTSAAEAFAVAGRVSLVVTEDSGLMHMAWVQGVPTVAIFGSTRSDWSSPLGKKSICLNSSDLPCGNCMLEVCLFGDNRCLTRYSPQYVLDRCKEIMSQT